MVPVVLLSAAQHNQEANTTLFILHLNVTKDSIITMTKDSIITILISGAMFYCVIITHSSTDM